VGETRWERTPVGETIPRIICDLRKWGISWGFLGFPVPFIEVNSLGAPSYIRTNTVPKEKFDTIMYYVYVMFTESPMNKFEKLCTFVRLIIVSTAYALITSNFRFILVEHNTRNT
jgi:hypothetical protein